MRYSTTLRDFPEDLTLNGIKFKNQFYYCPADTGTSHYSEATGHIKILDLVEILSPNS